MHHVLQQLNILWTLGVGVGGGVSVIKKKYYLSTLHTLYSRVSRVKSSSGLGNTSRRPLPMGSGNIYIHPTGCGPVSCIIQIVIRRDFLPQKQTPQTINLRSSPLHFPLGRVWWSNYCLFILWPTAYISCLLSWSHVYAQYGFLSICVNKPLLTKYSKILPAWTCLQCINTVDIQNSAYITEYTVLYCIHRDNT